MGLCSKVVSAFGFSGKHIFLESVFFHLEMFDVTTFRLVLVVCHVHVVHDSYTALIPWTPSIFTDFEPPIN